MDFEIVADGLQYPDGPIAMPDGSLLVAEAARGTITRIWTTLQGARRKEVVADLGGGPAGAAIGKDGGLYVCNNSGSEWQTVHGRTVPVAVASNYAGGRVERVNLSTGKFEVVVDHCGDHALRAPKDIIFDRSGGFWFAESGRAYERMRDHGGLYYVADGVVTEVVYPLLTPCGVGLSAEEKTLFVSDTLSGRLLEFRLDGPGVVWPLGNGLEIEGVGPGRVICTLPGLQHLDSLALDAQGAVCVATCQNGGITVFHPSGTYQHYPLPDLNVSNICFAGSDMRDAYITLAGVGQVIKTRWPTPGMRLNFATY